MRYRMEHEEESPFCSVIIREDDDGNELDRWWDKSEPEDNMFTRAYDWVLPELQGLAAQVQELDELCDALGELVEAERQLIVDLHDFLNEEYPGWDHTIAGLPLAERVKLYAAEPFEASDGGTTLYRGIREIKRLRAELARLTDARVQAEHDVGAGRVTSATY